MASAPAGRPRVLRRQRRPIGLALAPGITASQLGRATIPAPRLWLRVREDRLLAQVIGQARLHATPRLVAQVTTSHGRCSLDGTIREHPLTTLWPSFYGVLALFCVVAGAQIGAEGSAAGLVALLIGGAVFGGLAVVFARDRRRSFDHDVAELVRALHEVVRATDG